LVEKFLGEGWQSRSQRPGSDGSVSTGPGNVRQLINAIERAKIMADAQVIQLHDLPADITPAPLAQHRGRFQSRRTI